MEQMPRIAGAGAARTFAIAALALTLNLDDCRPDCALSLPCLCRLAEADAGRPRTLISRMSAAETTALVL